MPYRLLNIVSEYFHIYVTISVRTSPNVMMINLFEMNEFIIYSMG